MGGLTKGYGLFERKVSCSWSWLRIHSECAVAFGRYGLLVFAVAVMAAKTANDLTGTSHWIVPFMLHAAPLAILISVLVLSNNNPQIHLSHAGMVAALKLALMLLVSCLPFLLIAKWEELVAAHRGPMGIATVLLSLVLASRAIALSDVELKGVIRSMFRLRDVGVAVLCVIPVLAFLAPAQQQPVIAGITSVNGLIAVAAVIVVGSLAYRGVFSGLFDLAVWSWYIPLVHRVVGVRFIPEDNATQLSLKETATALAPLFRISEIESGWRRLTAYQSRRAAAAC